MEEDLDHILLDQLNVAKLLNRKMKKARKIMGDDPSLVYFQEANEKRIQY